MFQLCVLGALNSQNKKHENDYKYGNNLLRLYLVDN